MTLHHNLAAAKAQLREAKDTLETTRAIAEMGIVLTGKSADDRKRELQAGLARDVAYRQAVHVYRRAEAAVEQIQADLAAAEDARRDREWAIRAKLADALAGQRDDAAFELSMDRRMVSRAHAQADMDDLFSR